MMIDSSIGAGGEADVHGSALGDAVLERLRERVAMSLALEEVFVAHMHETAQRLHRDGDATEAGRLAELVQAQRLGFAERRATLAAAGIAV